MSKPANRPRDTKLNVKWLYFVIIKMLYTHNKPDTIHVTDIIHAGIKGGFITLGLFKYSAGLGVLAPLLSSRLT